MNAFLGQQLRKRILERWRQPGSFSALNPGAFPHKDLVLPPDDHIQWLSVKSGVSLPLCTASSLPGNPSPCSSPIKRPPFENSRPRHYSPRTSQKALGLTLASVAHVATVVQLKVWSPTCTWLSRVSSLCLESSLFLSLISVC